MTAPMIAPMNWPAMYVRIVPMLTGTTRVQRSRSERLGAVGDETQGHRGVQVSAGVERDDDTGEHREAPADGHHQEAAVVPLGLDEGYVGDH